MIGEPYFLISQLQETQVGYEKQQAYLPYLPTSIVLPPETDSPKVMHFGARVRMHFYTWAALFSHYGINQEFEQAYFQNGGRGRFSKLLDKKIYQST